MNKWWAVVIVFIVLIGGFLVLVYTQPAVLPEYTSFGTDLAIAIFGVAAVVIVVNYFARGRR
jgi:hypothetical protein